MFPLFCLSLFFLFLPCFLSLFSRPRYESKIFEISAKKWRKIANASLVQVLTVPESRRPRSKHSFNAAFLSPSTTRKRLDIHGMRSFRHEIGRNRMQTAACVRDCSKLMLQVAKTLLKPVGMQCGPRFRSVGTSPNSTSIACEAFATSYISVSRDIQRGLVSDGIRRNK